METIINNHHGHDDELPTAPAQLQSRQSSPQFLLNIYFSETKKLRKETVLIDFFQNLLDNERACSFTNSLLALFAKHIFTILSVRKKPRIERNIL